jgi:hypothetical protein
MKWKNKKRKRNLAILERLYTEFPEYHFLRSPLISHDNIIIVSVFGNDRKILSVQEVEKAELFVFTRIKYHKDWIADVIDRRLLIYHDRK